MMKKKKAGNTITVGLSKRYVNHGTKEGFGPIGGKGHGKAKAQTSGHVDPYAPKHDSKHMNKGSRGPFTKAGTGRSKTK